jgi:hypothetical protein
MNEIKSTLPAKIGGAEITRFNALRHGLLSRYTLHIRAPLGSAPRRRDPETPSRVGRTSSDRDRSPQAPVAFRAAYPLPSGSTLSNWGTCSLSGSVLATGPSIRAGEPV